MEGERGKGCKEKEEERRIERLVREMGRWGVELCAVKAVQVEAVEKRPCEHADSELGLVKLILSLAKLILSLAWLGTSTLGQRLIRP
eukprot:6177170-Pleurochrysis_carterae.AAC.4